MVSRRLSLALCCAFVTILFASNPGLSEDPPPIEANLTPDSGNNTVGDGPASFRLQLTSLDAGVHQIDILWELEAQNGTLMKVNHTNSIVTDSTSEEFWNHTSLSEGLWSIHATISPNGSSTWMIHLSTELIHLRPAEIVILPSATWDVNWNEAGGSQINGTPTSGDDLNIRMRVENLGDVATNLTWTLEARLEMIGIGNASGNTTVSGGERVLIGPLSLTQVPEGTITLILIANTTEQSNLSTSVDLTVGPPPLPLLEVILEERDGLLIFGIWNNGTAPGHVDVTCTMGSAPIIDMEGVALPTGMLTEITVVAELLEDTYTCAISSSARIHADSIISAQVAYNKSGPIWSLLSEPIAVESPRHVSDVFVLRVPIENAGGADGNVTLRLIHNGTISSGNSILVAAGSSEILSTSIALTSAGTSTIEWQVLDTDSETIHEQGSLNINVLPPQVLNLMSVEIIGNSATTYDLSAIIDLSAGTSRIVELEVTSEGIARHHSEQQIHPGSQTVRISVPLVDSDRQLLLTVHQPGWGSGTVYSMTADVNTSDPAAEISIHGGWPEQALPGDVLSIQTEVANTGPVPLAEGVIRVTRATDGFLLAEQVTPLIGIGGSVILTLEFEQWPSGPGGTVLWEYHSENGANSEHQRILTLPRQGVVSSKSLSEDLELRDVQIGAALGVMGITLIAIGRAVARSPSFIERRAASGSERSEEIETSAEREVQCPSCDQRLTVPSTYRGRARCTRCGEVFSAAPDAERDEELTENRRDTTRQDDHDTASLTESTIEADEEQLPEEGPESSSSTDVIECPTCSQSLRVPLDRRPAKARCPACSSTFMASANE